MKRRSILTFVTLITLLISLFNVMPVGANPPYPEDQTGQAGQTGTLPTADDPVAKRAASAGKKIDQPNALEVMRLRARQALLEQGNYAAVAELDALAVDDRVLVILVEYAGTDTFTWTPGVSTWDPIGQANIAENAPDGDCSKVVGIPTVATDFTYGPTLHNTIPRPLSAADPSGNTIWTPDFSQKWFEDFMFGNGIVFDYQRVDGSTVHEDFTGKSVVQYYQDMSAGAYNFSGDVVDWIPLPHSAWWYGADTCPGRRSQTAMTANAYGVIPGAGNAKTLVQDSLAKVEEMRANGRLNGFEWANYDQNGDNIIDRLWIVHAGYGEEDNTTLTNRTTYGEAALWSHSSSLSPLYTIPGTTMRAGAYIMMPENGGIGVFAHEYGHNLGAADLYAYGNGETSAGFWTIMADDWTGYPLGYMPPAADPWHLDEWGWLDPEVISDPTQVYTVTVGQASEFPGGAGVKRGVKIELPDGESPLPIGPATGSFNWWGGKLDLANAMMTLKDPIAVPAGGATFSFDLVWDIEDYWDFLWVQASTDGGATWNTLTNADTICTHDPGWIGELNGFPADLCAAGIGGFTSYGASYPDYVTESFNLDAATYGGQNVLLRFWYMTDWGTTYGGAFIDNILVEGVSPATTLFSDGGETGGADWTYADPFQLTDGFMTFDHNLYLQWRNTTATGGYDAGLGDSRYRYGPVNGGLLVWYNNNFYTDNEVFNYLTDYPSYGPKGVMLAIDSNSDPYRYPDMITTGYNNEAGNLPHRSLMRDAPFSRYPSVPFSYGGYAFNGRPAVPFFDDSLGYYPGAEYVSRGPGYVPPSYRWVTKQWDASTVVPSMGFYALKAPGYTASEQLRYDCSTYPGGLLSCYYYQFGLGYAGGTGNPGDTGVQYGWHVDIVSQTAETATLRIWNANAHHSITPDKTFVAPNRPVKFTYELTDAPVDDALFACADLDTSKVTYVSGTNAIPMNAPCGVITPLALRGGSLNAIADPSQVVAVAYMKDVKAGESAGFDFTVTPKHLGDEIIQVLNVYDNNIHRVYEADKVSTTLLYEQFMPFLMK